MPGEPSTRVTLTEFPWVGEHVSTAARPAPTPHPDLPMDPLVKAAMRRWAAAHRPAHQSTTACLTSPHLTGTPCNSTPEVSR